MKSKLEIVVVLPDIRSSYNIGSIFRTCDAVGVSSVLLTGYSPCPVDKFNRPQKEISKTALGAEKVIPWLYEVKTKPALKKLKKDCFTLIAIEQDVRSENYIKLFKKISKEKKLMGLKNNKIALIFGNEVGGIPKDVLKITDYVVDIPMKGEKESLNVSVSAGIVLYELINSF